MNAYFLKENDLEPFVDRLIAATQSRYPTVNDLARDVRLHGYYGGIRLVKAFNENRLERSLQQLVYPKV